MDFSQITLYVFIALLAGYMFVKFQRSRSVKNYTASEVSSLLKNNLSGAVLLDVRTPDERKARHIKGSLHIPSYELVSRTDELNKYKDKEIICYCASGMRSSSAAYLLSKKGFKAANMRGGISAWNG